MTYGRMNAGVNVYQQVGASSASYADPYELTGMLLQGAIDRVSQARYAVEQGRNTEKAQRISRAAAIISALRDTLNMEAGGELAASLDGLYEYMERRLLHANIHDDAEALQEVAGLLGEIKTGWDGIPVEARSAGRPDAPGVGNGTIG